MLAILAALLMQAAPTAAPTPHPSVVTMPDWIGLPTVADFAALYPKEAAAKNLEGRAVLACQVGAEGLLTACSIAEETPSDQGFGAAALAMAPKFQMRLTSKDGAQVGDQVRIPVRFKLPPLHPAANGQPPLTQPLWERKPRGEDMARVYPLLPMRRGIEGAGTIDCLVTAQGTLADCQVVAEGPLGEGFGEAALKLAPLFKMAPVTKDGRQVEGGVIRIPMRWVLPH